jgi:hypothetical protein
MPGQSVRNDPVTGKRIYYGERFMTDFLSELPAMYRELAKELNAVGSLNYFAEHNQCVVAAVIILQHLDEKLRCDFH